MLEVIKRSSDFLEKRGVDSPRLQTELLLAHVLNIPRLKLYLDFDHQLSESQLEALRAVVKRRGDREPLQYIVGTTSFCGMEMSVTPAVLIPRPETEALAERAWEFARTCGPKPTVLDFGTGSGCIGVAIAVNCPAAQVYAIDTSAAALEIARANAQRHNAHVEFHRASSIADLLEPAAFDLIVSNPPYIASSDIAGLQPEVRVHEPRSALDGGPDGLQFFRMIANQAQSRVTPTGRLMLEFADGQASAATAVLTSAGWRVEPPVPDLGGHPRILIARR